MLAHCKSLRIWRHKDLEQKKHQILTQTLKNIIREKRDFVCFAHKTNYLRMRSSVQFIVLEPFDTWNLRSKYELLTISWYWQMGRYNNNNNQYIQRQQIYGWWLRFSAVLFVFSFLSLFGSLSFSIVNHLLRLTQCNIRKPWWWWQQNNKLVISYINYSNQIFKENDSSQHLKSSIWESRRRKITNVTRKKTLFSLYVFQNVGCMLFLFEWKPKKDQSITFHRITLFGTFWRHFGKLNIRERKKTIKWVVPKMKITNIWCSSVSAIVFLHDTNSNGIKNSFISSIKNWATLDWDTSIRSRPQAIESPKKNRNVSDKRENKRREKEMEEKRKSASERYNTRIKKRKKRTQKFNCFMKSAERRNERNQHFSITLFHLLPPVVHKRAVAPSKRHKLKAFHINSNMRSETHTQHTYREREWRTTKSANERYAMRCLTPAALNNTRDEWKMSVGVSIRIIFI